MKLIKFIGLHDYLLDNITTCKLNFNNVSAFNDPFEGIFRFQVSNDRAKFMEFYLKDYSGRPDLADYYFNNLGEFNSLLNKTHQWRVENNAVSCFSSVRNQLNVLMWAHYCKYNGESNNGICLVFDSSKINFTPEVPITSDGIAISSIIGPPKKINYIKQYLSEDPLDRQLNADVFLRTKFWPWAYEKEYRYIGARAGRYFYPDKALVEIVFGLRLARDKKIEIKALTERYHPHIKLSEIRLKKGNFGLEKIAYLI